MLRKVAYTIEAESQLIELEAYIAARNSEEVARRFVDAIDTSCKRLAVLPHVGRRRDDILLGMRTVALKRRVLVAFRVSEEQVTILAVLYGGRDLGIYFSDSPGAVSTSSASHYAWGDGCDGWHLVQSDKLSVIEERMPPGTAETRHLHSHSRQFFYVLEGTLTIETASVTCVLQPGEGSEIAPGIAHQVFNRSLGSVRFLVISQPPAQGDRTDV